MKEPFVANPEGQDVELTKIAYVDDEDDIRELGGLILQTFGEFEVRLYASGAEALAGLVDFGPNLVLLDIMMPEMDGREVFRRLAGHDILGSVPVVFITAMTSGLEELRDLGPAGIIAKPYDPARLCDEIGRMWRQYHAPDETSAPA